MCVDAHTPTHTQWNGSHASLKGVFLHSPLSIQCSVTVTVQSRVSQHFLTHHYSHQEIRAPNISAYILTQSSTQKHTRFWTQSSINSCPISRLGNLDVSIFKSSDSVEMSHKLDVTFCNSYWILYSPYKTWFDFPICCFCHFPAPLVKSSGCSLLMGAASHQILMHDIASLMITSIAIVSWN